MSGCYTFFIIKLSSPVSCRASKQSYFKLRREHFSETQKLKTQCPECCVRNVWTFAQPCYLNVDGFDRSSKRLWSVNYFSGCKRTGEMQKTGCLLQKQNKPHRNPKTTKQITEKRKTSSELSETKPMLSEQIELSEHSVPLHDDIIKF